MKFDSVGPLKEVLEEFSKGFLQGLTEDDLARRVRLTLREESDEARDPAADLREKIVEALSDD
jgi:hypothetical protein